MHACADANAHAHAYAYAHAHAYVYDHLLGRTGLIIGLYGVVFHGEDARVDQKGVALQNNMKTLKQLQKISKRSGRFFFRESTNEMWGIV